MYYRIDRIWLSRLAKEGRKSLFFQITFIYEKKGKTFTNEGNIQTAKVHLRTNLLQGHIPLLPIK